MRLNILLLAFPLSILAVAPAGAQDVVFVPGIGEPYEAAPQAYESENSDDKMADMADRMSDPLLQDGIAATVENVSRSMMQLPVGRLAEAIERARPGTVDRRLTRDATVADLAGRDADYLPQRLGDSSREMMGMMSGFARAMAVMMPQFERMGREMEDSFRAAKAEAKRSRY